MKNKSKLKIAVLPGDGIGKDVTYSSIPVLSTLNIPVELTYGDIGWQYWVEEGTPIPERTWELIHQVDAVLLGATTSKPPREAMKELHPSLQKKALQYTSPIIQLRHKLDLYANVRPCYSIKIKEVPFHFLIIRENTEGLYSGFDFHPLPPALHQLICRHQAWRDTEKEDLSCSLRIQSKKGLKRIFEFAFKQAEQQKLPRVTLADKANVLRESGAFARELFEKAAFRYPHIQADILNVDAVAMWMVKRPEQFGVIVAENMFADILSDVGAGLMGGLGFAPSANLGEKGCYFEPVHGSAPHLKKNQANPSAMFLTLAMMLEHFKYVPQAEAIKKAVIDVVNKKQAVTYDLNGNTTTEEMAQAIINHCDRFLKDGL